jgi:hypothetical protein
LKAEGAHATQFSEGRRIKLHGNARLSVKGRELLVERIESAGWSLPAADEAAGVTARTARKWLALASR